MRTARTALACTVVAAALGCDPDVEPIAPPKDVVDVFPQRANARVDVLWVVDNSPSMAPVQAALADRFAAFFGELVTSRVDYHIGVVTTDARDGGVLRAYAGQPVEGCAGCRFLSRDVPCAEPDVDVSGLDDGAARARLADACPARLVFADLVTVGSGGGAFEEAFLQAATALGVDDVDAVLGLPAADAPPENDGFARDDAALYLVIVSDEDEGGKADGAPVRYYQRLFENVKGRGDENRVAVATIAGYPHDDALPPIADACRVLGTTFDADRTDDDPRAPSLVEALRDTARGCTSGAGTDEEHYAEPGGRAIELACRTGGVVADMCSDDYTVALHALGADASALERTFCLSSPERVDLGTDGVAFSADDVVVDCDGDGIGDQPLCVRATALGGPGVDELVARDPVAGYVFEAATNCVRFAGRFVPAPGTDVTLRYGARL